MGRSQVKYRNSRRGRSSGPYLGTENEGRRMYLSTREKLGSNAYRYEEHEINEEDIQDVQEHIESTFQQRQYFKDNINYRPNVETNVYLMSNTVKKWEENTEIETTGTLSISSMDFEWLGNTFKNIPRSQLYDIEEKYCCDFEIVPIPEVPVKGSTSSIKSSSEDALDSSKHGKIDTNSKLLQQSMESTKFIAKDSKEVVQTHVPVISDQDKISRDEKTEELEEWLDDILDQ